MHGPTGNKGQTPFRQFDLLTLDERQGLALQRQKYGFMGMTMLFVGNPWRNCQQAGIQDLQLFEGWFMDLKVNAMAGIDIFIMHRSSFQI